MASVIDPERLAGKLNEIADDLATGPEEPEYADIALLVAIHYLGLYLRGEIGLALARIHHEYQRVGKPPRLRPPRPHPPKDLKPLDCFELGGG